jgi:hypothetical protein
MITITRSENHIIISVYGFSVAIKRRNESALSSDYLILCAFSDGINDDDAIKIIKELKAERDLISFGLSLNGENLTSDRITEIDRIISKLSERFIDEPLAPDLEINADPLAPALNPTEE